MATLIAVKISKTGRFNGLEAVINLRVLAIRARLFGLWGKYCP
jgi:hypothetical protein